MLQHTQTLVLDGTSSFLVVNWMGSGSIQDLIDEFSPALASLRLCDLYGVHGWYLPLLQANLSDFVVTLVTSFSFRFSATPNRLFSEPNSSGDFSVSSAY